MTRLALMAAGITLLTPTITAASQPAQTPPAQAQTSTDAPADTQQSAATGPKSKGAADTTCDTSSKSASGEAKVAVPSAKVGKDTGESPPPRKKPSTDAACSAQPQ